MKKKSSLILGIIVVLVIVGILLAVFNNKKNVDTNNESSNKSTNNGDVSSDTTALDCSKTIQKYLEESDKGGKGEGIKAGDNIVVDYIGRLEDGTVFDTSIESVAKACDKYNMYRDYVEGLSFEVGAGQMIKGFDNGVVGMKVGQTKTVKFGPDEGYGQRSDEYVITYSKDEIGDLSYYNVGDRFAPNPYIDGIITKITDKEMVVDFNHELAGKDLIFDITIKSIN